MSHHPTINKKCLLINGQNNRKTKPNMKADQSFSATIQISLMNLLLKNLGESTRLTINLRETRH